MLLLRNFSIYLINIEEIIGLIDIYYTVKVDSNLKIDSDLDFNIRCVFTKSFVLENVAHVKFLDYGMEVNFKF